MKHLIIHLALLFALGACVELPHGTDSESPSTYRVVPKSFAPPSSEMLEGDEGWRYEERLEVGGETKTGLTNEFVAYDTTLRAGDILTLSAWSSGWASLQVFGAPEAGVGWEEITANVLSNPGEGEVEAGARVFEAPYSGHYLFLIGPVMAEDVQYLLRVDCQDECD